MNMKERFVTESITKFKLSSGSGQCCSCGDWIIGGTIHEDRNGNKYCHICWMEGRGQDKPVPRNGIY